MNVPWWFPFGSVAGIHPAVLATALNAEPALQLVDVRTGVEYAGGHIRGAVNVPITALVSRLASLGLDRSRPVVAVCLSAHRSPPAVRLFRRHGYDAVELAGGMLAWRAAGLPEEGRPVRA